MSTSRSVADLGERAELEQGVPSEELVEGLGVDGLAPVQLDQLDAAAEPGGVRDRLGTDVVTARSPLHPRSLARAMTSRSSRVVRSQENSRAEHEPRHRARRGAGDPSPARSTRRRAPPALHQHPGDTVDHRVAHAVGVDGERRRTTCGGLHHHQPPSLVGRSVDEEPRPVEQVDLLLLVDEPDEVDPRNGSGTKGLHLRTVAHDDEPATDGRDGPVSHASRIAPTRLLGVRRETTTNSGSVLLVRGSVNSSSSRPSCSGWTRPRRDPDPASSSAVDGEIVANSVLRYRRGSTRLSTNQPAAATGRGSASPLGRRARG